MDSDRSEENINNEDLSGLAAAAAETRDDDDGAPAPPPVKRGRGRPRLSATTLLERGQGPSTTKAGITKRFVKGAHQHPLTSFALVDRAGRMYKRVDESDPLYAFVFPQGPEHARALGETLLYVRFATAKRAEEAAGPSATKQAAHAGMGVEPPNRVLQLRARLPQLTQDVFEGRVKTFVREHASAMGYVILKDLRQVGNYHVMAGDEQEGDEAAAM